MAHKRKNRTIVRTNQYIGPFLLIRERKHDGSAVRWETSLLLVITGSVSTRSIQERRMIQDMGKTSLNFWASKELRSRDKKLRTGVKPNYSPNYQRRVILSLWDEL